MKKSFLFSAIFTLAIIYGFLPVKKEVVHGFNQIEKNWCPIQQGLLANKFEVTNLEYQVFLKSTSSNTTSKIYNKNWQTVYEDATFTTYYHQDKTYHDYPVVNITQEGAKQFCKWLTNAYNSKQNRKYKKILVRLPTEAEWIAAARAGHETAPFPWGGYYVRNGQGEFLANFRRIGQNAIKIDRVSGQIEIVEKGTLKSSIHGSPAAVNNYCANNYGLYNTSGNVAKMLAESG